ncbi:pteridine-dependent deoxygenase like protein [Thioalkalivibrio nitratireducens DSM 14787]|uniref:Pteridine-dependent deoxygenase like protein n=1 Tax=Thioalkalivibrio nitratireducens (strain DSM 14787 / UNIQEM 213 / ALEN2) TaxID=1255043 RepID=L0DS45_THIND|nr:pteridine-dependent deoxygenase like protein [Thioalkalivibrio nitratireducens DSM 14787]
MLDTDVAVAAEAATDACLHVHADHPPGIQLAPNCLSIAPGLRSLSRDPLIEIWSLPGTGRAARAGTVYLLEHEDALFAAWHRPDDALEANTRDAYRDLFLAIQARGFTYPIRIWNYFSRIHAEECGLERYQSFCIGRARALEELGVAEDRMPAATAIGTGAPGLFVYLIAAREPGAAVENPRQVSAYHYPEQYSPESPAFARATRIETADGPQLLLSGTASITGHESRHAGDCPAQAREILANLDALHAAAGADIPPPAWLRVYLRRPEDRPDVASVLAEHYPRLPPLQWVQGDVCRRELLVEIEGVYARTP